METIKLDRSFPSKADLAVQYFTSTLHKTRNQLIDTCQCKSIIIKCLKINIKVLALPYLSRITELSARIVIAR